MSKPRVARDVASRALEVSVRLLPSHRSDWGEAMRAELAALDDIHERRRYARGCGWAALRADTARTTVGVRAIAQAFGAVALAFAFAIRSVGVRIEAVVFVVTLGVVAWWGHRRRPLGPTAENRPARRIRSVGYAVLGSYLMAAVASSRHEHDRSGVWVLYLALTLYLAALVCATARGTGAHARTLHLVAALAFAGLSAWWVPMLLLTGVRADSGWALLSVAVTVLVGAVVGVVLHWPDRQVALAALGAGAATCLLIFIAAQSTYVLLPQLVPDLGFVPGMTAAGHVEQNRIEAIDPYVAELLLGAVLAALLVAASSPSSPATPRGRRPHVTQSPGGTVGVHAAELRGER